MRQDRALVDYLLRNKHTSPFEQVILTFHVKMPIFVARQWIRHRTARLNEISGRYSVMRDEFYLPSPEAVRFQSKRNKQGRDNGEVPEHLKSKVLRTLKQMHIDAYEDYDSLLEDDIARELARINLPLSSYTEMYWQIDLSNLFHFLNLRMDDHAQHEIHAYSEVMAEITSKVAPAAYAAFEEHILNARNLSAKEVKALQEVLDNDRLQEELMAALDRSGLRKSRRTELLRKLGFATQHPPLQAPLFAETDYKPISAAAD